MVRCGGGGWWWGGGMVGMVTMVTLPQTFVLGDGLCGDLEKIGKGHHSHHSVVVEGGGEVVVGW